MNNYCKVMFGKTSGADSTLEYKLNEVNIASIWNPKADNPASMGGFNFTTYDMVFRWLVRGDTIYDIEIPEKTEVVKVNNPSTPNGVFRTNKIIITNPRPVTDSLALELYKISNLPEKSYYKALAGCMIRGYKETCLTLIKEKVNKENINLVLSEIEDFVKPENLSRSIEDTTVYYEIMNILNNVKHS